MKSVEVTVRSLLLLLLLAPSGCYSFSLLQADLPPGPGVGDQDLIIRVTMADGENITLKKPWLEDRMLWGWEKGKNEDTEPRRLDLSRVELVEERVFDREKTVRAATYVLGALGVGLYCGGGRCWEWE